MMLMSGFMIDVCYPVKASNSPLIVIQGEHNFPEGPTIAICNYYQPQWWFREGNVFTGVCLSTTGGVYAWSQVPSEGWGGWIYLVPDPLKVYLGGASIPGGVPWVGGGTYGWQAGGTHPTKMLSCII